MAMPEKSEHLTTPFIRDEKTGRYAFNAKALKASGVDPAEARERGYPLKELQNRSLAATIQVSIREGNRPAERYYDWWPIEESSLIRQAFEICNRRFEALFQRPAGSIPSVCFAKPMSG